MESPFFVLYELSEDADYNRLLLEHGIFPGGLWLGHLHDSIKGWYNVRTNTSNTYLNSISRIASPICPVCCLLVDIERVDLIWTVLAKVVDCNSQAFETSWYLRTRATRTELRVANLKKKIEQFISGSGGSISLEVKK